MRSAFSSVTRRPLHAVLAATASAVASSGTGHAVVAEQRRHGPRHAPEHAYISGCRKMDLFFANTYGYRSRLAVAAPEVAVEWDADKNAGCRFPGVVSAASMDPAWWLCQACGHSFSMSPEQRVVRGGGCPKCSNAPGVDEAATRRDGDVAAAQPTSGEKNGKKAAKAPKGKASAETELPGERNARFQHRPVHNQHSAAFNR